MSILLTSRLSLGHGGRTFSNTATQIRPSSPRCQPGKYERSEVRDEAEPKEDRDSLRFATPFSGIVRTVGN